VVLASAYWVDTINFGINKGLAVQQLQKRLHIAPKECAAFGDYMNDAEMMSSVYYSYAMANAHPKVKSLARYEAGSNAEYGVIKAIRDLIDKGLCGERLA
jgi:hydroxymethylpyrimidine pyrophosphatase-like HAD family hydrolase